MFSQGFEIYGVESFIGYRQLGNRSTLTYVAVKHLSKKPRTNNQKMPKTLDVTHEWLTILFRILTSRFQMLVPIPDILI
jgi:hypothetical protein